jgi:hypothetical protein
MKQIRNFGIIAHVASLRLFLRPEEISMEFAFLFDGARRSVLFVYVSTLRREKDAKGAKLTRPLH